MAHLARIGIDVGGTFTDVVMIDEATGAMRVAKVLNQDADRATTVVRGINRLLDETGLQPDDISWISHGTTITTNAIIERKGARTALITNKGFRDILEIGRFARPPELIYRIHAEKPAPFVDRALRLGVGCRIDRTGTAVGDLDEDDLAAAIATLRAERVEAVAVCFLFSFLNPVHEIAVREILARELPGVQIVLSSEILREFREYPRTSTTVFAAYIAPVLRSYVENLETHLRSSRIAAPLYIFQSNGGIAKPELLMRNPALTVLSGPAGAVVGAAQLCGAAGFANIITMDIGGTSLDVCVIRDGAFASTRNREIDMQPIAVPMLNVLTAGAGGGSIVRVDDVGRVTVGPDSVAANPGPACYGRGGIVATLTDVNVVLGLINPATFANGEVGLTPALAGEAVMRDVGARLGLGAVAAASGVYRLATNQIAEAIQKVTVEGGHDPADFTLVAFGGGGPLHACAVAREVGILTVLVPRHPGMFSARGIAYSDFFHDYVRSVTRPVAAMMDDPVAPLFGQLIAEAHADLGREAIGEDQRRMEPAFDLRYVGQSSEITVPVGMDDAMAAIVARFHGLHEMLYSFGVPGEPVELVNIRLRAVGIVGKPPLAAPEAVAGGGAAIGRRTIHLPEEDQPVEVAVYDRAALPAGHRIEGPAVIEEASSTTFMPSRSTATIDPFGNLVIQVARP